MYSQNEIMSFLVKLRNYLEKGTMYNLPGKTGTKAKEVLTPIINSIDEFVNRDPKENLARWENGAFIPYKSKVIIIVRTPSIDKNESFMAFSELDGFVKQHGIISGEGLGFAVIKGKGIRTTSEILRFNDGDLTEFFEELDEEEKTRAIEQEVGDSYSQGFREDSYFLEMARRLEKDCDEESRLMVHVQKQVEELGFELLSKGEQLFRYSTIRPSLRGLFKQRLLQALNERLSDHEPVKRKLIEGVIVSSEDEPDKERIFIFLSKTKS